MAELPRILPIRKSSVPTLGIAWGIILLFSILPDILFNELAGTTPPWLFWVKLAAFSTCLVLSLVLPSLRSLRGFFLVVLAIFLLERFLVPFLYRLGWTPSSFGGAAIVQKLLPVQFPRFVMSLAVIVLLLAITGSRRRIFLRLGEVNATAKPIPYVLTDPPRWGRLGIYIAAALTGGVLVFVLVSGGFPSGGVILKTLPLLPVILLLAANNAFGEEMIYRASLLSTLEVPLGASQALLTSSVLFGIGHYYGVPYGALGVIMSTFAGWLLGKAMLETRGMFWSWLIHFCMDVSIFFLMAVGSVTPGG